MPSHNINSDINVLGKGIFSVIPNQVGQIVTISAIDGKTLSTRTNVEIKTDLELNLVDNTADESKNVLSATKLLMPVVINGTYFDGSGNITTYSWGTARNITIGSSTKSVDGSDNITWSLAEIGVTQGSVISGTMNFLTKINDTNDNVINSQIIDLGNFAGIGTINPTTKWEIDSGVVNDSGLKLSKLISVATNIGVEINPIGLNGSMVLSSDNNVYGFKFNAFTANTFFKISSDLTTTEIPVQSSVYNVSNCVGIVEKSDGLLYCFSSNGGGYISKISKSGGVASFVISGLGYGGRGLAMDSQQNLYASCATNGKLWKINNLNNTKTELGSWTTQIGHIVYHPNGFLYVCQQNSIYKVDIITGSKEIFIQGVVNGYMSINQDGNIIANDQNDIVIIDINTAEKTSILTVSGSMGVGVVIDAFGEILYTGNKGTDYPTYKVVYPSVKVLTTDSSGKVKKTTYLEDVEYLKKSDSRLHTHSFSSLTDKPTTILGYGITDVNNYAPTLLGVGASGNWNINSATATTLKTAKTINGVAFDGSQNIMIVDDTKETTFAKNTAFNKNFGNVAGTVTEGNDTRLSDSRIASDVYAWAKAAVKPTYTKTEVGLPNVDNTSDLVKNVLSSTKLFTPRLINGTSFDGSADILTTKWGTARNITIGSSTKSVDGSGNISWTLAEIGASSGGVVITGISNILAKFNPEGNNVINSQIKDTGVYAGVGTLANPTAKWEIDSGVVDKSGLKLSMLPDVSGIDKVISTCPSQIRSIGSSILDGEYLYYTARTINTNTNTVIGRHKFSDGSNILISNQTGNQGDQFVKAIGDDTSFIVKCYTPTNAFVKVNKTTGVVSSAFNGLLDSTYVTTFTAGWDGYYYLFDAYKTIRKYDANGVYVATIGTDSSIATSANSILLGNDMNLYYSDRSIKGIRKMTPSGITSTLYVDAGLYYYPTELYSLPDGSIIFHDGIRTFYKVTLYGIGSVYHVTSIGGSGTTSTSVDSSGTLYFTWLNKIYQYSRNPKVLKTDSNGNVTRSTYLEDVEYMRSSDAYTWIKNFSKPTYNFSEILDKPTTILGYGITDVNNYAPTLLGVGASGNWNINSATATTLKTAKTINGVAFDGSIDILTTKWGTARNITIGSSTKSVDGSGNISWTLAEIGAANQLLGTINYLPKFTSTSALGNSSAYFDAIKSLTIEDSFGAYAPGLVIKNTLNNVNSRAGINFSVANGDGSSLYRENAGNNVFYSSVGDFRFMMPTEVFRITGNGKIGIGTSTPLGILHISDTNGGLFFDGSNASYNRFKSTGINPTTGKDLLFSAQTSGVTPDLYIKSNGNVVIGNTDAINKFEVKVVTSTGSSSADGISINDGAVARLGLQLGVNTAGEYSWIQSVKGGVGSKSLALNPIGGNVVIGKNTLDASGSILQINGTVTASPATLGTHLSTLDQINKTEVGLPNVDNTSDVNKPVSNATQTALNLKANLNSPTFTGYVYGLTQSMVGLSVVNNTTDLNKPVSTATQTALNLKANKNGDNVSGTWGINITGKSSFLKHSDGPRDLSDRNPNWSSNSVVADFVSSISIPGSTGNYCGVMTFSPWDGNSTSTGDSSYQLAFINESGVNGAGLPGLKLRKGIDSSWGSWYSIIHSGNHQNYSLPLTGGELSGQLKLNSQLIIKENGVTTSMGPLNGSWNHMNTDSINGWYFYNNISIAGGTSITANSITSNVFNGNLDGKASNASNWDGLPRTAGIITNPEYIMATVPGGLNAGIITSATMKTFLGLGSNAYTSTKFVPNQDGERYPYNVNDLLTSGFYNIDNVGPNNAPNQAYSQIIVAKGIDTGLQISGGYISDKLAFRGWSGYGSSFTPWRNVWHDGNFNPSSYLPLSGGTMSGNITMGINSALFLDKHASAITGNKSGISYYSSTRTAWSSYMAPNTGLHGPTGNITPSTGTFVTSWAKRDFIENENGYGWIFESGGINSTTPSRVLEISSVNGNMLTIGNMTANGGFYTSSWFRSDGASGWYSETYGGGIHMSDATYVRVYNGKQFLCDNNIVTNSNFLCGTNILMLSYGSSMVGQYGATRYQGVYSMGDAYKPSIDGTSLSNHYGIAWTYQGMGQAKPDLGHQMLITEAGVTQTAIGNGIWTRANIYAAGTITAGGDIIAYSDISVKENIRPITNVIEKIQGSRGVIYDRIDTKQKNNIGFIAQEIEVNFPELVITNEDGTKAVKYQNAVAVLFEAIKEQQNQIDELKHLIKKLIN